MALGVTIPRSFSWLLPAQGFVAAVVIYASIYVFTVGTIPFILAVVAAGLHFLLGLYLCFTGSRAGSFHLYIVPVWLIGCAGVWAGALYYFAAALDGILKSPFAGLFDQLSGQPLYTTWIKVGTATAALNVVLDFILLAAFIHGAIKQTSRPNAPVPAPIYSAPPIAPQAQIPPLQTQQYTNSQQYQPYQTHQQYPSFIQYQPQPTYGYPPQLRQHQASPVHPLSHNPSHDAESYKAPSPPLTVSPPAVSVAPAPAPPATPKPPYDVRNRIDVIRRLCALQHPDGHWDYSEELAELVRLWGGRELMAPAHGVTALSHACLMDLCNYVWTAQREGREQEALSAAELISLQAVNWDLAWAKNAMDRATGWMSGYR